MKKTILLPILAWAFSLHASAELKMESLKITGKDARSADTAVTPDINMPVVLPLTGPAAANINDALYIELFGALAPPKVAKKYDVGVLEWTTYQQFSVTRNDRILTLEFDTEGCSAYCESFQQVFAFDAKTGRRITAADVLTSQGQDAALRLLRKRKIAAYSEQIEINRADLQRQRRKKAGKDVIDDLQERIELNADCLAQAKEPMTGETIRWHRLNPTKEALLVTAARCSNHAMRALDDVDQVTVKIPYGEIKPHLTPYGRSLFFGEGDGKPTELFGQVLRGRIGANPITMLISNGDGENVQGSYFYNRQRKRLEINGQRRGNTIELIETVGGDSSHTGKFVLTIDGSTIKGMWGDMKGTKQFDVIVSAP